MIRHAVLGLALVAASASARAQQGPDISSQVQNSIRMCAAEQDRDRQIQTWSNYLRDKEGGAFSQTMATLCRGMAYQAKGEHANAIADFDVVAKEVPHYAVTYRYRARSHAALGQKKLAAADNRKAAALERQAKKSKRKES
jgi:Tfp pilus assembly protein PilF